MGGFHGGHGSSSSGFHGGGHHISSSSSSPSSSSSGGSGDGADAGEFFGFLCYVFGFIFYFGLKLHYRTKILIAFVATICLALTMGFGIGYRATSTLIDVNLHENVTKEKVNVFGSNSEVYKYTTHYTEVATYEYTYYGIKYTYEEQRESTFTNYRTPYDKYKNYYEVGETKDIYVQLFNPSVRKDKTNECFIILAFFLGVTVLVFFISSIYDISQARIAKQIRKRTNYRKRKPVYTYKPISTGSKCPMCGAELQGSKDFCPMCEMTIKKELYFKEEI